MIDQNNLPTGSSGVEKTILDELGLQGLPEDKKNQLLIKMTEVILKRIFLETMEKLSEKEQADYEALIDEEASPEKLEGFLREKIAGYDQLAGKVISDFRAEMMRAENENQV